MRVDDDAIASARDDVQVAAREPEFAARGWGARVRVAERWPPTPEQAVVLGLGLLVLVVHDVGYLLGHPFWLDEAWVAVTTRFPLSQLPATTSATPIGWSVVLRIFTLGRDQTSRLLPLAFAGAAVMIAYWFAKRLDWRRREASVIAGLLSGFGVLLVPAMLTRNDLKQYTADACMALLALAVISRLERQWSRRGLVSLSVTVWGGMLFSHTVAFVGVAAFGALCLVELACRSWGRLVETTVAGAGTAIFMLGVYDIFDARAFVPSLTNYWSAYYLPIGQGVPASMHFVMSRFDEVHAFFGLGPAWLAVGLFIAGVVTIFRLGRPATALTVIVLMPEMLILSALKRYPFLDLRTSTFLFAVTVVVAAIGVAGLAWLLRPAIKGRISTAVVVLALVTFAVQAQPFVGAPTIPLENVRDQARYVAAHVAPNDVTVVSWGSNWAFAYYWPIGHPSLLSSAVQSLAYFPDQPRIVAVPYRTVASLDAAVSKARTLVLPYPGARIWLVRAHLAPGEKKAWAEALQGQGLIPRLVGHDGLSVAQVSGSAR
jgi:hypothetical protein